MSKSAAAGVVRATKAEAEAAEEHFDGQATEAPAPAEPKPRRGAHAKPTA